MGNCKSKPSAAVVVLALASAALLAAAALQSQDTSQPKADPKRPTSEDSLQSSQEEQTPSTPPATTTPVPPGQCTVMVSFNHKSTGPDAVELTDHLNTNGIKTFCTDVWCPRQIGDNWQVATTEGVFACKYFVILMDNGWQKSYNCQNECRSALQRQINEEITIIPVKYSDFDTGYDKEKKQFWIRNLGATKCVDSKNKSPNDWMEKITNHINNSLGQNGMYYHNDQNTHTIFIFVIISQQHKQNCVID
jgi:hypothetical protein